MTATPQATPQSVDILVLSFEKAGRDLVQSQATELGKKCAVIETQCIGRTCPNIARLPSRNFIYSADVAHRARLLKQYGTESQIASADVIATDMKAVVARSRR